MKAQLENMIYNMEFVDKGMKAVKKVDMVPDQKVADWRSLFSASLNQTLSYFPPQKENGKVVVSPPHEVLKRVRFFGKILWWLSLVVRFLTSTYSKNWLICYRVVKGRLLFVWLVQIFSLSSSLMLLLEIGFWNQVHGIFKINH